jgi:hypothetical protein
MSKAIYDSKAGLPRGGLNVKLGKYMAQCPPTEDKEPGPFTIGSFPQQLDFGRKNED